VTRRLALTALLVLISSIAAAESVHAQSRKPTAQEVAAIRDCAMKNRDNLDAGQQDCLFKLVAERCMGDAGSKSDGQMADCYEIEGNIWNDLLNENYKTLLGELDADQTAKAKAMQRAWIAYRDTTCQFYYDKIQGTMAVMMIAACVTRETARRALLLDFFSRL
jgi:uncharacterized protein YecT (DUF1311 family)